MKPDNQKVLFAVGASSDIGCALIRNIQDNYSLVVAHYFHSNETLEKLKEEMGDRLELVQANLADKASVDRMLFEMEQKNLFPDHIVHFASKRCHNAKFIKEDPAEFQMQWEAGVESIVCILHKFMPRMVKKKAGKVVMMLTSYVENIPPRYLSPYVTAKYALLGLMKSLAAEYSDKGIQINGVSPEMMETKFLKEIPDLIVEQNAAQNPLGRNLRTSDVVPAFAYLLSEAADCVTGQNIVITGGK